MHTLTLRSLALAALATLAATGASAQSAGSWLVRGGLAHIAPDVKSGNLTAPSFAGTQADIGSASQLAGGVTYMLSDHWAVDLPLALPFKHEITGAGAIAGVGKIGEVKALPATVLAQYRFGNANANWRPFVGVGLTYAKFFKERSTATLSALTGGTPANPTTLKVDSKFTATIEVGATVNLQGRWFAQGTLGYTPLKTRTTLSTGQTLDAKLDPMSVTLGVGYRF